QSFLKRQRTDECWYVSVEEPLPESYRDKASGSLWAAVLENRDRLSYPAALYVEGTDQHRGWFQKLLID
ncbi:isoleucine--tRNA ligase, chloroplastic/mitochondrial, partial [Tanacetum coccineum]